ncbi:MAG: formylglycine-generating enzyme family protein [Acaryochloris sp. RU_4_1]|nr:formylglycine-generating enzyme family protein [Acaryochloris sp. RU_4_1]
MNCFSLNPQIAIKSASAVLADLHPPPKPLTTTPLTPQPPAQSLPTPTPQEIPFHPPLFGSQSVGSPPAKSSPTPNSKGRRQFLTLAAYGGVGLGSVLLWKAVDSSQKGAENSDPPPELSLDSPTPSPEATPEPNSSPSPSPETSSSLQNFSFEVARVDAQGKITNRSQEQAQFFAEDLGSGITLDMVAIPAGQFTMGSPASEPERDSDESPQHQVSIPAFYLGKYEITQAQWQAIMGSNPSGFQGANRPVEQVSWNEAIAFCQKLSQKTGREYRLPSEAEWEYACRAGTSTPFHFGPTLTPAIANYDGTSTYGSGPKGQYRQQTIDVGSFPPNAFGLYDMHGNVWEWCQDTWHDNYTGAPTDGSAWVSENDNDPRILRGGSWLNDPRYCRCANRGRYDPGDRPTTLGFRVALSAPRTS